MLANVLADYLDSVKEREFDLPLNTLLLAFLTYLNIQKSDERENRDREERLLNEVRDWALEAVKTAVSRQTRSKSILWETRLKYKYVWSQRFYIRTIADKSFKNLCPLIDNVSNKLSEAIEVIIAEIENKDIGKELVATENKLRESVENLLIALASKDY
ncbi:hypothetical protein ACFLWI_02790 [Chloroflexota bacterium]